MQPNLPKPRVKVACCHNLLPQRVAQCECQGFRYSRMWALRQWHRNRLFLPLSSPSFLGFSQPLSLCREEFQIYSVLCLSPDKMQNETPFSQCQLSLEDAALWLGLSSMHFQKAIPGQGLVESIPPYSCSGEQDQQGARTRKGKKRC